MTREENFKAIEMTRSQKIQYLKDLQAGKVHIDDLLYHDKPETKIFIQVGQDAFSCDDGRVYGEDEIHRTHFPGIRKILIIKPPPNDPYLPWRK